MKKLLAIILTIAMVISLAACGSAASETTAETTAAEDATETEVATSEETAAWTQTEPGDMSYLDDDQTEIFNKAAESAEGSYTAVACLATQVVAGTNYAFLTYGNDKSSSDQEWGIAIVYEDTEGNVELSKFTAIDIAAYRENEVSSIKVAEEGGWTINEDEFESQLQSGEDAFNKVIETIVGSDYDAYACLGTQVVAGTNYAIICRTTAPVASIVMMFIYEDVQGNAEILSTSILDVADFTE